MRDRLADQQLGLRARALDPEDRDEGRLAGGGVGADRLAGLGGRALDIEQIVGDLEREPEIVRIAAQRGARLRPAPCRGSPRPRRKRRSSAPVFIRCSRVIAPISSGLMLGDQIDHLAADHAGGAGRGRQRRHELAAHRRIAMRVGMRQHLEGQRSAARRRPAPRSPRRTPCGRSAGRAADRCCPSPADRHAPANRHAPSRSPRRPAARCSRATPNRRALASTRNGRSRLPGPSAA